MPTPQPIRLLTPDQYIEQERTSDTRHEYCNGYTEAMAGASRTHNLLAGALFSTLRAQLHNPECHVYMSDMKLRVQTLENDRFFYPDVMVSCDREPPSDYYEDRPSLVAEVLSDSTETKDRFEKLAAYSKVRTLSAYLTVSQKHREVVKYTWRADVVEMTKYLKADDRIVVSGLNLSFTLDEIYKGINM